MTSSYITFLSDEPIAYGSRINIVSMDENANGESGMFAITSSNSQQRITLKDETGGVDNFIIVRCTKEVSNNYSHRAIPTHIIEENIQKIEMDLLS